MLIFKDDSINMDKKADEINNLLEKSNHPFFVWKYLIIFGSLDLVILSVIALGAYWDMFFPEEGGEGSVQIVLICVVGIFALGFLTGYFVFRLIQLKFGEVKPIKQELFSNINDENTFESKLKIYLFSATTGLINLGISFFVYSYFTSLH